MVKKWTTTEYSNLYQTDRFLSNDNKKTLGILMPIEIYVQDPYIARMNNQVALKTIHVKREPDLMDGPTSSRIAVVDYDADTNQIKPPARWNGKKGCFERKQNGKWTPITKAHCETPQFHQVNVWAIIF